LNDGEGTGIAGLESATVAVAEPAQEKSRRRGPNETAILVVFYLLSLAAVGLLLWHEEHDALHDPQARAQRGDVGGAQGDSLVRGVNFAQALRKIDGRLGPGDVINGVRLSPIRVDVTARDRIGKQRILSVDPGLGVSTRDFGESDQPGVRVAAIDPAAPERIFTEVMRRAPAKPANLDYFVYTISTGSAPRWLLYLDGVDIRRKQWEANARGVGIRPLGQASDAEAKQRDCLQRAGSAEAAASCQQ
jgi:hypothetical protein